MIGGNIVKQPKLNLVTVDRDSSFPPFTTHSKLTKIAVFQNVSKRILVISKTSIWSSGISENCHEPL